MRYPESVDFLYALGNEIKTVKFGLEAITAVIDELGHPEQRFPVVHVAGTNGKGSTCAMIEAALRKAGYRTGLYTSPHLIEPTERIRISGVPVTRDTFVDAFNRVHAVNQRLLEQGVLEHHTTYFETVTAMGFLAMAEAAVDIGVVEVGLGGRLDATNVVNPELCVITPVDFDHEQYLGSSLDLIAREKAGILKPGVPVVLSAQKSEAHQVLLRRAQELDNEVLEASELPVTDLHADAYGSDIEISGLTWRCPLAGIHQIANAMTAITALRKLGVEPDISAAVWPGRLQRIGTAPEILLDGAHNPAGARSLAEHLRAFYSSRRVRLVYGAMRDKSVEEIIDVLFPLADEVIVTAPSSPRAVRPEVLLNMTEHPNARVIRSVSDALQEARWSAKEDVVVITGSLYLIGEVLALLQ